MTAESKTTVQRVAAITGGHTGIGLAITGALAAAGCSVAVGSRTALQPDSLNRMRDVGPPAGLYELDVCSTRSINSFVTTVEREVGQVDILVNCAGVSVHHGICGHTDEDWDRVIDTNLTGPFRMTRALLPGMISRGWGRIVNIGSTAASAATATHAAYCASKSGLLGLSRATAVEGAPAGVTCVTVSPTWVETDMLRASAHTMAQDTGRSVDAVLAELKAANPQNRLVQADEIGALVAFLCTDAAAGITMEDIQVNAGAFW